MAAIFTCKPEPQKALGKKGASMHVLRMRPRQFREQCFIEDEGRPLGVRLQEWASNHLKLRGLRVRVVSVEEKAE
jgi:hypothetical protein